MERICIVPKCTCRQIRCAGDTLWYLSRLAFFAGLVRPGVMFAQIRLQLMRIGSGIPLDEFGWLCLADLFNERRTDLEEAHGDRS